MIIDKTIGGEWYENSTELDDVAYYLYVKYKIINHIGFQPVFQSFFLKGFSVYQKYFDNAKIILRKEKIEKILSRGNR